MKKVHTLICIPLFLLTMLSGCGSIGDKSMSMSVIYVITTLLSLLILLSYTCLSHKRNIWFLLLFSSVFIVNSGYLSLAMSTEVNEALLANRISYLGSVFLPMSMLMLILEACNFKYKKWFPLLLASIGIPIFLIAASPGYSDIYYESVSLVNVNGMTVLDKVYGPWHSSYLYYLVGYFATMIAIITYSVCKKKVNSSIKAAILFIAVFINIGIWLIEQLVNIEFEILSISYIASELFLLSLELLFHQQKKENVDEQPVKTVTEIYDGPTVPETEVQEDELINTETISDFDDSDVDTVNDESETFSERCDYFASQLNTLTPAEKTIYELYLTNKSTKEVLAILNIKESTLKYHNKNIYSKLGVSSKKQLLKITSMITK